TKRTTKTSATARTRSSSRRAKTPPRQGRRPRGAAPVHDTPENGAGTGRGTSLIIVESPAKAKTIGKYLGRGYRVTATVGHLRALPEKKLGIDVDNGFEPEYVTIQGKEKTLAELKTAADESSEIFLATDPDREGEAIAWHVAGQIRKRGGAPIRRARFHEITKDAVKKALEAAGDIDDKL